MRPRSAAFCFARWIGSARKSIPVTARPSAAKSRAFPGGRLIDLSPWVELPDSQLPAEWLRQRDEPPTYAEAARLAVPAETGPQEARNGQFHAAVALGSERAARRLSDLGNSPLAVGSWPMSTMSFYTATTATCWRSGKRLPIRT